MRAYLRWLLGIALGGLLAGAVFNLLVDPYALFGLVDGVGFNHDKPEVARRQRMSKPYIVRRLQPDVVVLGTSRALHIDANHPALRADGVSYNLALTGSSIYEHLRYLQHAEAVHPLKRVVLGLDFFMFRETLGPNYAEDRLDVQPNDAPTPRVAHWRQWFRDAVPSLLSYDAIISSLVTLDEQVPASQMQRYLAEDRVRRIARAGGHRAMFDEATRGNLSATDNAQSRAIMDLDRQAPSFRGFLRFAYQHHIDLRMFISPSHARMFEDWRVAGLWPRIEQWKRDIVRINDEEAARAGEAAFPLWDFSGYNSITTEPIPPAGDTTTLMPGYWESSHYTTWVGNLILDRLFDDHSDGRNVPADFGVRLTAATVEGQIAATHAGHLRYAHDFPGEVAAVEAIARKLGITPPTGP